MAMTQGKIDDKALNFKATVVRIFAVITHIWLVYFPFTDKRGKIHL